MLLALEALLQRLPFDEGHDVERRPLERPGIEDGDDVRVLQLGADLDLAREAIGAELHDELGARELDGDRGVVLQVARAIDRGHPPRPDRAFDAVAVGQHAGKRGGVGRVGLVRRARRGHSPRIGVGRWAS
ncbi:MAG: hypothetical protein IPG88_09635 [Gemmatimonadetes bacterium]|nr:hypothetical protein [Gemmatimonadota bacterium]